MEYFKSDGKNIILEAEYAEFYLPVDYLAGKNGNGFAEDLGRHIHCLGIMNVGFFKNGELQEMKILNAPTWIDLNVYDSEVQNVKLPDRDDLVQCKVIKYFKGNAIMDARVIMDSINAQIYLQFVVSGKIPESVPYSKAMEVWNNNLLMNDVNLGVPSVILELILSLSYRDKNDLSKRYSEIVGKDPSVGDFAYKMVNIRTICQYASTFTSVTFEDMDAMLTSSINRTKKGGAEVSSPIEKLFKM